MLFGAFTFVLVIPKIGKLRWGVSREKNSVTDTRQTKIAMKNLSQNPVISVSTTRQMIVFGTFSGMLGFVSNRYSPLITTVVGLSY